jgi:signal transduction histidine kinase
MQSSESVAAGQPAGAELAQFYRKQFEKEILEVLDREKERLGRELHVGLCPTLAGISALSATLARKLARSDATALANRALGEATAWTWSRR